MFCINCIRDQKREERNNRARERGDSMNTIVFVVFQIQLIRNTRNAYALNKYKAQFSLCSLSLSLNSLASFLSQYLICFSSLNIY